MSYRSDDPIADFDRKNTLPMTIITPLETSRSIWTAQTGTQLKIM